MNRKRGSRDDDHHLDEASGCEQCKVLLERIRGLEQQLKEVKTPMPVAVGEDLVVQTARLRARLSKSIRDAMVWNPSCKTGSAVFSVSADASFDAVKALLGLPMDTKPFKRQTIDDLNEMVPNLQKQIRYDLLWICGPSTVRYDESAGEVTVVWAFWPAGVLQEMKRSFISAPLGVHPCE